MAKMWTAQTLLRITDDDNDDDDDTATGIYIVKLMLDIRDLVNISPFTFGEKK